MSYSEVFELSFSSYYAVLFTEGQLKDYCSAVVSFIIPLCFLFNCCEEGLTLSIQAKTKALATCLILFLRLSNNERPAIFAPRTCVFKVNFEEELLCTVYSATKRHLFLYRLTTGHRSQKEDLDGVLYVLEVKLLLQHSKILFLNKESSFTLKLFRAYSAIQDNLY